MTRPILLVLSLACSISLAAPRAIAADPSLDSDGHVGHASQYSSSDLGITGVLLRRLGDGSTVIEPDQHILQKLRGTSLYFSTDTKVIRVADKYAKGRSIEELNKMLSGPVDSSLEVTLVEGDRQI